MVAIVTRAGKGSPLTNTEVDSNFINLNNGKVENTQAGILAALGYTPGSLSTSNTWTGAQNQFNNRIVGYGDFLWASNGPGLIEIGTDLTAGSVYIGGTGQYGGITLGRSVETHGIDISSGAITSGRFKDIRIGSNGLSGSTTRVYIGSSVVGASNSVDSYGTWSHSGSLSATSLSAGGNAVLTTASTYSGTLTSSQVTTALGYTPVSKAGDTMTGKLVLPTSTTTLAPLNIPNGVNVTSPVDGDLWGTSSSLSYRAGGTTYSLALQNQTVSFTNFTSTLTSSIGTSAISSVITIGGTAQTGNLIVGRSTATQTTDIQAGATASGNTKTINFGTGGLSGSTTAITIGSAAGTTNVTANGSWTFGSTISGSISGNAATVTSITSGQVTTALGYTPLNPTTSQTANTVYAAPNGAAGAPTFRALVAADIPALSYAPTAGSTSITTLGTIGTGTWQGSTISPTYGGTGINNGTRTLAVSTNSGTLQFSAVGTTLTISANASISGTNTGDQTITLTGDVTGSGSGSFATTLANSGVVSGSYGSASAVPVLSVDAKGRVTSISTAAISAGITISDDTTTNATRYLVFEDVTSGSSSTMQVSSSKLTFNPSTGTLTATSVTGSSDERLKTNWRDIREDFVEVLAQIKHGIYDRTDAPVTQAGVSAQSLWRLLPEVISKDADGYLSVAYGNAALVAAIALSKQVVELKKQIKSVQEKLGA